MYILNVYNEKNVDKCTKKFVLCNLYFILVDILFDNNNHI